MGARTAGLIKLFYPISSDVEAYVHNTKVRPRKSRVESSIIGERPKEPNNQLYHASWHRGRLMGNRSNGSRITFIGGVTNLQLRQIVIITSPRDYGTSHEPLRSAFVPFHPYSYAKNINTLESTLRELIHSYSCTEEINTLDSALRKWARRSQWISKCYFYLIAMHFVNWVFLLSIDFSFGGFLWI